MLGKKLTIVVLDNRGYGCINRLQRSTGSVSFNNLLADTAHETLPDVDFARTPPAWARLRRRSDSIAALEAALTRAKQADRTSVIVIDTDPLITTEAGGWWWDVAVPEVSERAEVRAARAAYEDKIKERSHEHPFRRQPDRLGQRRYA
jgi:3D-(3,5/4)-trihydroxycyclohexane-1,2-dione acylhydrolase (decyclizing)